MQLSWRRKGKSVKVNSLFFPSDCKHQWWKDTSHVLMHEPGRTGSSLSALQLMSQTHLYDTDCLFENLPGTCRNGSTVFKELLSVTSLISSLAYLRESDTKNIFTIKQPLCWNSAFNSDLLWDKEKVKKLTLSTRGQIYTPCIHMKCLCIYATFHAFFPVYKNPWVVRMCLLVHISNCA